MPWCRTWTGSGCEPLGPRLIGLLAFLVGLAGCAPGDPAAAMLEEYRDRVARVVAVDVAQAAPEPLAAWPRPRERVLDIPPQRIGLRQFLSLHRCDLGALIGERSSPLGRVMTASRHLAYEHRFLLAGRRCLERLEPNGDEASLREELAELLDFKSARLPRLTWNATLGSDVLAVAHALDVLPLDPASAELSGQDATAAIDELARRIPILGRAPLDMAAWQAPWEALSRSRFPARLRRSMQLIGHHLDEVARLLETRQAQRPLCPQGRPTRDAEILRNLLRGYHGEQVQPYLVAVDGAGRVWFAALQRLRQAQAVDEPPAFAGFARQTFGPEGREWQRFQAARERHTAAWQDVLDQCALTPGAG